ncbi:MAG: 4-alpha-glucanotransferase [Candidatus Dormibacteraeota bacterium]|nr:4-alpha-glucanotransferase [Candidatus Dormibacteraeota bacterium]
MNSAHRPVAEQQVRARAWRVAMGYHDQEGRWQEPAPEVLERILAALGGGADLPPPRRPVRFLRPGQSLALNEAHELLTEDGAVLTLAGRTPADLPAGYHELRRLADGARQRLIVSPGVCRSPSDARAWAWAVQLYALRSRASWGLGDLADLRELGRWSKAELGAGGVLLNPLHAALPTLPQQPSPYYPASRRFRSPLYLRVEEAPGAERLGGRLEPLASAGRALNQARLIDRDRVFKLKLEALAAVFETWSGDPDLDRYVERESAGLRDFAHFCVLSEQYGSPWQSWPQELHRPDSPAVARFAKANRQRVRFHEWLQWLLDRQLAAAAGEIGLINDMAVGVQSDGADTWLWPDAFAEGVSVGAPPDSFNPAGQNWGVLPFHPWRLGQAGYEPFIQTVRAAFRHGAGLRFDHVMGLFRLFWIPAGSDGSQGAYVHYPFGDLLDVLALESQRAGAFVVGEDLGTVEPGTREELSRREVLSYRLLWFEEQPPESYPARALAALTTHDLPTLAGVWGGVDTDPEIRDRLREHAGLTGEETVAEVIGPAHRALARSPAQILCATLEDALGVAERPNHPGGDADWPNWRLALPLSLEQIQAQAGVAQVARALSSGELSDSR